MDDEISFHSARALAALDLARQCRDVEAARGHLRLAEEHLGRLRGLLPADAHQSARVAPAAGDGTAAFPSAESEAL